MARTSYPLEALRQLRDERAEAQAHSLAAQIARSQAAEALHRVREQTLREHLARTAESSKAEQERVAAGGASGVDLQRMAEFELAARAQAVALQRAEAEARQALAVEREAEQALRVELAAREAEAKLVQNHEQGFHARQTELQQKAEEEAALEQWNARRH